MAAQVEIDDQESFTNSDHGEIIDDSFSDNADSRLAGNFTGDSTVLLREDNHEYDVIKNCFLSGMGPFAGETTVVAVRKNSTERVTTKAKFAASVVFTEAMKRKNGGNANVRYGWYSGSKEEIDDIISYGFSSREIEKFENDNGSHGVGIHLIHHKCSLAAAIVEEDDEEGLKHLLLCRLILGKPEQISSGSNQSYPSSVQYDSGVDNLENPRKYVIWSCNMNSYILPSHVVSFRSPRLRDGGVLGRARSPCVSLSLLMSILPNSLDPPRLNVILTAYDDFRKRKLKREQLVRKMREVVGDELLLDIIKNQRDKD
ncbi:hypothetical protein EUTSA_v10019788mg [Eutrema salsugineum]|uniref:Inactive poly [ADP-ribose] polymerase SRO2 n=1 Tax=Eutrema salsugineum TaxID=72664 RepID=V4JSD0_EUTSA|nr:hypothetical protein EUTSA_v10019788mg [Eutrema salsugineum]